MINKNLLKVVKLFSLPVLVAIGQVLITFFLLTVYGLTDLIVTGEFTNITESFLNSFVDNFVIYFIMIYTVIVALYFYNFYKEQNIKIRKIKIKDLIYFILLAFAFSLLIVLFKSDLRNAPFYIKILITTGILGPILEELMFRGYIYNKLKQLYTKKTAIILVTLLFSIMHITNGLYSVIFSLALGIALIALYNVFENLKMPIAFHISINSFIIILGPILSANSKLAYVLLELVLLVTFYISYTYLKDTK